MTTSSTEIQNAVKDICTELSQPDRDIYIQVNAVGAPTRPGGQPTLTPTNKLLSPPPLWKWVDATMAQQSNNMMNVGDVVLYVSKSALDAVGLTGPDLKAAQTFVYYGDPTTTSKRLTTKTVLPGEGIFAGLGGDVQIWRVVVSGLI